MSLTEVLGHRVDQHFVLSFKAGECSLELLFQIHQMLWHLTYKDVRNQVPLILL